MVAEVLKRASIAAMGRELTIQAYRDIAIAISQGHIARCRNDIWERDDGKVRGSCIKETAFPDVERGLASIFGVWIGQQRLH